MMPKIVRKKPASASEAPRPPRFVKTEEDRTLDEQSVDVANQAAIAAGGSKETTPPKIHGKVVQFMISVGTDDRERSVEDFIDTIKRVLSESSLVNGPGRGAHVTSMSQYYVLDGKVCLPNDYDPKTQNFKPGATPPAWAGGPKVEVIRQKSSEMIGTKVGSRQPLSAKEFDKKFPNGDPRVVKPAPIQQDEDLEEVEWEAEDIEDDEKMSKAANEVVKGAVKKLAIKKKVVVKKPAAKSASASPTKPARRVVRRK